MKPTLSTPGLVPVAPALVSILSMAGIPTAFLMRRSSGLLGWYASPSYRWAVLVADRPFTIAERLRLLRRVGALDPVARQLAAGSPDAALRQLLDDSTDVET